MQEEEQDEPLHAASSMFFVSGITRNKNTVQKSKICNRHVQEPFPQYSVLCISRPMCRREAGKVSSLLSL